MVMNLIPFIWGRLPSDASWVEEKGPESPRYWLLDWPAEDLDAQVKRPSEVDGDAMRCALRGQEETRRKLTYQPSSIESGGMFLDLAYLDGSRASILAFAHRHGLLGLKETLPVERQEPLAGLVISTGESLEAWRDAIRLMRLGVFLWQADTEAVDEELVALAREAIDQVTTYPRLGRAKTPTIGLRLQRLRTASGERGFSHFGHAGQAATVFRKSALAALVNEQLRGAAPRLEPDQAGHLVFGLTPENLWSFLWVQLAQAASGDRHYLRCGKCGRWVEIDHGESRSNRKYCSASCKQLAYRRRKSAGPDYEQLPVTDLQLAEA